MSATQLNRSKLCTLKKQVNSHLERRNDANFIVQVFSAVFDSSLNWKLRLIWGAIFLLSVTIFSMLMYDRISFLLSEPTVFNTDNTQLDPAYYPAIELATTTTPELVEYKKKFKLPDNEYAAHTSISYICIIPVANLLSPGKEFNLTATQIWNLLNSSSVVTKIYAAENPSNQLKVTITYKNETTGISVKYTLDKSDAIDVSNLQLVIEFKGLEEDVQCPNSRINMVLDDPQKSVRDLALASLPLKKSYQVAALLDKFESLNKRRQPCTDIKESEDCELDCFNKKLKEENVLCRLPFMKSYIDVPDCISSNYAFEMYKNASVIRRAMVPPNATSNPNTCKCTPPCDRIVAASFVNPIMKQQGERSSLTFLVDNNIKVSSEEIVYGFIDFLCDTGGNLGLCLGLSCLSLIQVFTGFYQYWKLKCYYPAQKISNCVNEIIGKEEIGYQTTGLNYILQDTGAKKRFWLFLILFWTLISLLQIYYRFVYYLSWPVNVSIEVQEIEEFLLPTIIVCPLSPKLVNKKRHYMLKNSIKGCPQDYDMLNLMNDKISAQEIWKWTKTSGKFFRDTSAWFKDHIFLDTVTYWQKGFNTIYGECTAFHTGVIKYHKMFYGYVPLNQSPCLFNCSCHMTVFPITPGDIFRYQNYLHLPYPASYVLRFRIHEVKRKRTPTNPCVKKTEMLRCEKKCIQEKLQKEINCSLPFLDDPNLLPCTTTIFAMEARSRYLSILLKTDLKNECKCQSPCDDLIYYPEIDYEFVDNELATSLHVTLARNRKEIIKENYAFPFVKFLCDLGSNLGSILGVSILSLLSDITCIIKQRNLGSH